MNKYKFIENPEKVIKERLVKKRDETEINLKKEIKRKEALEQLRKDLE